MTTTTLTGTEVLLRAQRMLEKCCRLTNPPAWRNTPPCDWICYMTTLTSTLPDSIGRVKAELQGRRRRLHFISGLSQGKIPIPFNDDTVRKWMFEGGFRVDSFADLYETPMKYLDSVNIKALEREIGDMSKALEVLQKQDKSSVCTNKFLLLARSMRNSRGFPQRCTWKHLRRGRRQVFPTGSGMSTLLCHQPKAQGRWTC